ncbi:MAG: FAD-dependent oxidoreductase [Acidimicrobiales bacterium]
MASRPRRVAIVGGGMAGLAAAWRLSSPHTPPAEVTVYQRGWRLGGKGASSRSRDGRILEHGLHIWLGYYDNAFRLMRDVYDELDRPARDPGCPIATFEDAFTPANTIGLADGQLGDWVAVFPTNGLRPGEGDATLPVAELITRASALAVRFGASLDDRRPRAVLSTRAQPPREVLGDLGAGLRAVLTDRTAARRVAQFAELLAVMVRGVVADNLAARGYAAIDHLDFRAWLAQHGASSAVLDGPFVRGVYDLVFGYEQGDRDRPRFAAGAGVHLSGRMFLTYRGAMFWKMEAGMGDTVFAPLYEVLTRRGVRFEFFHRLENVHVDGDAVTALTFGRQLEVSDYDPLVRIGDLPVFPEHPEGLGLPTGTDLEGHGCEWTDAGEVRLEADRDFDTAVLAVSLGMVPHVAAELVDGSPAWRSMIEHVATVPTQAAQLWFDADERDLGWAHPGAIVTGHGAPFDTVASMSHTVAYEQWEEPGPRSSVSLCAVLAEGLGTEEVGANLDGFLRGPARRLWPGLDGTPRAAYWRANVDPSDRYVQSLPGTAEYRLRADESGFTNLVLAGDWLDTGLNAGCIEAATLGGLQAANVVAGRPITDQTVGFTPYRQVEEDR